MKRRDVVLTIISLCSGRAEFGRTSLQKVAYFCGLELGRDLGHRPHYYGPYSETIEQEVDALVLSDLVEEKTASLGFTSSGGFEARRFECELTEPGKRRIQLLKKARPEEFVKVEETVDRLLSVAGSLDQRILSSAAKTLFIASSQGKSLTTREVASEAKSLGWNLSEWQVDGVADLLAKLGYIRRD